MEPTIRQFPERPRDRWCYSEPGAVWRRGTTIEHANQERRRLLRAGRVRPCRRRIAERTEKFAPPHVQPQSQEQASQWAKTIALRKGRGWPSMLLGGDGRCPRRV